MSLGTQQPKKSRSRGKSCLNSLNSIVGGSWAISSLVSSLFRCIAAWLFVVVLQTQ